jgi:transcriptional regulator with XRE-family HTH domain
MAIARAGREGQLYAAIGGEIRARRTAAGKRQEELAEAVSLSRSSIANAEAGRQAIPIHHLVDIAKALGTTAADILASADERRAAAVPEARALPKAVVAFLERATGARR